MRKYGFVFSDAKTQVKYIPLICSAKARTALAEPEFRTKWITHLHAVIPGAC